MVNRPVAPPNDADRATDGLLSKLIERQEITGKKYELVSLLAPSGIAAGQLLVVGLGEREQVRRRHRLPGRRCRGEATGRQTAQRSPFFSATRRPSRPKTAVAGAIVGCQGQDIYRAEKETASRSRKFCGTAATPKRIACGQILGESINLTRRLVNEPPQEMYPESFAAKAAEVAQGHAVWNARSGISRGWKKSAAARCWPWPAVRRDRRDW